MNDDEMREEELEGKGEEEDLPRGFHLSDPDDIDGEEIDSEPKIHNDDEEEEDRDNDEEEEEEERGY